MGDPRTVPAVSGPELERFYTEGSPAYQAETSHIITETGVESGLRAAFAYSGEADLRLACCGNLRASTPKHKPDCQLVAENCPGCVDGGLPHLRSCRAAVGVDVPGVGLVEDFKYPDAASFAPGRPHVAGEVPEPLRRVVRSVDEERERLLCGLLFAAAQLAKGTVGHIDLNVDDGAAARVWTCRECKRSVYGTGAIQHKKNCRCGRVLQILDDLQALPSLDVAQFDLPRQEIVPEEGDGAASEGIGAGGEFGEPWRVEHGDILGRTRIFDRDGVLVAKACGAAANGTRHRDLAHRIADCVNSAAGNRSRLDDERCIELYCRLCGEWNGRWTYEVKESAVVTAGPLRRDQCILAGLNSHTYTLYTHHCAQLSDQAVTK
jgi:hypothetical protein